MSILNKVKSIKRKTETNTDEINLMIERIGVPRYIFDDYFNDHEYGPEDVEYLANMLKNSVEKDAQKELSLMEFSDYYWKYIGY